MRERQIGLVRFLVHDDMTDEQVRLKICRTIAEDLYAAGLGWHEDVIERFTRPRIAKSAEVARCSSQFVHRRHGIKGRHKGKVQHDATR